MSVTYGPQDGELTVTLYREGALAAMGHDLVLRFTDFRVEVGDDRAIEARVRTGSIEVAGALENGRVQPSKPSPDDRRRIERDAREQVLEAGRYREAIFRSRSVQEQGDGWRVRGALDLHGAVREVAVEVRRDGDRVVARLTLNQPAFNIKPFKAALGALRVKPDLEVELALPAPPAAREAPA